MNFENHRNLLHMLRIARIGHCNVLHTFRIARLGYCNVLLTFCNARIGHCNVLLTFCNARMGHCNVLHMLRNARMGRCNAESQFCANIIRYLLLKLIQKSSLLIFSTYKKCPTAKDFRLINPPDYILTFLDTKFIKLFKFSQLFFKKVPNKL